jgi:hypothetical protein
MIRKAPKSDAATPAKGVIGIAPPSFRRERALLKRGVWPVAGCDEAGRGRWPGRWSPPPWCWIRNVSRRASTIPRS